MRFGQFRLRTLLLAAVPFACLMWCCTCLYYNDWEYSKYTSFHCGDGRRIVIGSPSFAEIVRGYEYEVVVDGKVVVPKTYFFDAEIGSKPRFSMVKADGGTLIAVFERDKPYDALIIHDFRTGESWPYDANDQANPGEERERELALRKRIEAEHPQLARVQKLRDREYLESTDWLDLADGGVTDDDLRSLDNIHTMRDLHLERNNLTDDGLMYLRGLDGLTRLDLTGNDVTDVGLQLIGRLETLRKLNLSGTQITDAGLLELRGLTNLELLDLRNTKVSAEGIAALNRALPNSTIDY